MQIYLNNNLIRKVNWVEEEYLNKMKPSLNIISPALLSTPKHRYHFQNHHQTIDFRYTTTPSVLPSIPYHEIQFLITKYP